LAPRCTPGACPFLVERGIDEIERPVSAYWVPSPGGSVMASPGRLLARLLQLEEAILAEAEVAPSVAGIKRGEQGLLAVISAPGFTCELL